MIITCKSSSSPGGEVKKGCWDTWNQAGYKLPETGHVLAPWVAISFYDMSDTKVPAITVSNHSSESTSPKHSAVIKSFTYSYMDGSKVSALIHDVQGGSFETFMKHLAKDWLCIKNNLTGIYMKFSFGWVKSNCKIPAPDAVSPCYFAIIDAIETNFSEGKFIFDVTGVDAGHRVPEGATEFERGGEGIKGIHFMDAAKEYACRHQGPNFGSIDFRRREGKKIFSSNKGDDIFWSPTNDKNERIKGIKSKYISHGRDKLHTLRAWASTNTSINRRSWIPVYDSTIPSGGELVFWELEHPECNTFNPDLSIGTYIVNGSKSSPVIEFNPKIRWNFAGVTSTGGAGPGDQGAKTTDLEGNKNPGHKCLTREETDGAGVKTETVTGDGLQDTLGKNANKEDMANDHSDKKAIQIDTYEKIGADLVVVGDPTLPQPVLAKQYYVSIVLINPFAIIPHTGFVMRNLSCGEWLSGPPCNSVLSNNAWHIEGISHSIEAGKFISTIRVSLATPGVNIATNLPFGASALGWKPVMCS